MNPATGELIMVGWLSVAGFALIILAGCAGGIVGAYKYQRYRGGVLQDISQRKPILVDRLQVLQDDSGFFPKWASFLMGVGVVIWLGGWLVANLT